MPRLIVYVTYFTGSRTCRPNFSCRVEVPYYRRYARKGLPDILVIKNGGAMVADGQGDALTTMAKQIPMGAHRPSRGDRKRGFVAL